MTRVRVAVPNKGVMAESVLQLLGDAGLDPRSHLGARALEASLGAGYDAVFVAAANIPEFVADGAADAGITGWDLVCESGRTLAMRLDVELAPCRLVLAGPADAVVDSVDAIAPGTRVATVFPRLTRAYLADAGVEAEVVEVSGAVEITPRLGVAELIVDLVATGSTLRANQLVEISTLLTSSARLVTRPDGQDPPALRARLDDLAVALGSVVQARNQRYLMANVPRDALGDVRAILPGIGGPDVVELLDGGELIAVQAVVALSGVTETIAALKAIGASGIVVTRIERFIP
jgi:ATP phosphoribosyltransferase